MNRVFVYGTLLTGAPNWGRYLAPKEGVPAFVRGMQLWDGPGFPYATYSGRNTDVVLGEVFNLDDGELAALDRLEGHPHHYWRVSVQTSTGRAWTYIRAGNRVTDWPEIPHGDWLDHVTLAW